jgi:hypothetical protein
LLELKLKFLQDKSEPKKFQISNPIVGATSALSTLMSMANDPDDSEPQNVEAQLKPKTVEFEGRGTVPCHIW